MNTLKRIRTIIQFDDSGLLEQDQQDLQKVGQRYATGITAYVADQIHQSGSHGPVAKQYIPDIRELCTTPQERTDPIGDDAHTPVKGIVHRYPDRVLFKITSACAVYCRFCFRKDKVGKASESLSKQDIDRGLDYIRVQKNILEVILSGGDPLVMPIKKLHQIIDNIFANDHVQILRIHTRLPVVDPSLFSPDYCTELGSFDKIVYLVVHVNHADELTPQACVAFQNLRKAGIVLLSQSVILKGVNDTPEILEGLLRKLVAIGIKPYYLHHPDLATGTSHFRVSLNEGVMLMRALRGRLSGIAWPTYVIDLPGGFGKMPIDLGYVDEIEKDIYMIDDYKGHKHLYPPDTDV